jgi:hypothetical protein
MWGAIIGGALTGYGQYRANKESRNYATKMSGTAHQRQMADLKAAGINPMLAGRLGGASTPSYQAGNIGAAAMQGYGQYSSARQAQAQTRQADAQTGQIKQQTKKIVQEVKQMKDLHNERWQRLFATMGPDNIAASVAAAINNVDVKLLLNQVARKTSASVNTMDDLKALLMATQAQKSWLAQNVSGLDSVIKNVFKPSDMRNDRYTKAARGN